jgi:hypothetical protein
VEVVDYMNIDPYPEDAKYTGDKALSFHWKATGVEWLDSLNLPAPASSRAGSARASILLDAVQEAVGLNRWISYSRNKTFYSGKKRYQGTVYAYSTVPRAVDELALLGCLEHVKAPQGPDVGWQSIFRATPLLIEAVSLPLIQHKPAELIVLKDAAKRLVDYRDTERTCRMRRNLSGINEAVQSLDLDIEAPGQERDGNVIRFPKTAPEKQGQPVAYLAQNSLYRVFNGVWRRGGRFYGPWWQNIPKRDRDHIKMDGLPTIEEDYEQLHPRLLYRMAGKPLHGDAYTLDGWERDLCKIAFNVLLNAANYRAALGAVTNEIGGQGSRRKAVKLIAAIKRHHAPVKHYFNSGVGRELQNLDSRIAEDVMLRLRKQGIVSLPIHDSFIVPANDQGVLLEAMDAAFQAQK